MAPVKTDQDFPGFPEFLSYSPEESSWKLVSALDYGKGKVCQILSPILGKTLLWQSPSILKFSGSWCVSEDYVKKKKRGGGRRREQEGGSILVAELTPVFQHPSCAEGPKTASGISLSLSSRRVSFVDDRISAGLNQPGPSLTHHPCWERGPAACFSSWCLCPWIF